MTWFIWLILGITMFVSQQNLGAEASLWFIGLQTLGIGIICALSIKYGTGGFGVFDVIAGVIALISVYIWFVATMPIPTLIAIIVARSMGVIATVVKTYQRPKSESSLPWMLYTLSAVLAIISVGNAGMALLIYPVYVLIADLSVLAAKYHKRRLVSNGLVRQYSRN
jgi:hypothetical protein